MEFFHLQQIPWVNLEHIMLNEMSDKERQILYDITYIWSITKTKQTNEYNKTETDLWIENKLVVTSGDRKNERGIFGVGD